MARKSPQKPTSSSPKKATTKAVEPTEASTTTPPPPRAAPQEERRNGGPITLSVIFMMMLIPFLSLTWTPEAPLKPFATFVPSRGVVEPQILLVTAHPDDEVLFAPTVLSMLGKEKSKTSNFYSLCLSTGDETVLESGEFTNAPETVGVTRKKEWEKSWGSLGLPEGRRWILDVPSLKDNNSASWDAAAIADQVEPFVWNHGINTILTFDHHGVTNHPNHRSIHEGIIQLASSPSLKAHQSEIGSQGIRLFVLKTVPAYAQFGVLSGLLEHIKLGWKMLSRDLKVHETILQQKDERPNTVFISDIRSYLRSSWAAMHHRSQFSTRFFALVFGGKYLWVNEWVEIAL